MVSKTTMGRASVKVLNHEAVARLKRRFASQGASLVIALFLILLALPFIPGFKPWMAGQLSLVLVYVIAAQGISILTGYTGLVSVGHGGFLAIGAYTSALLVKYTGADIGIAIVASACMAGAFGFMLGLVFLRLAGPFLAIGTLGFAFFIGTLINNVPFFEGREGISLPVNKFMGLPLNDVGFYFIGLGFFALVTLFIFSFVRSSVGRALMALRDAEKAAQSCGVNRFFYRMIAFTVSATITGAAGALNGFAVGYVSAEVYSDIWYSVDILVAVILGGSAMMMGPIVGGTFVALLPFLLETLADLSFILKGVILIAVLIFAPAGICELIARPFKRWRLRQIESTGKDTLGSAPSAVLQQH